VVSYEGSNNTVERQAGQPDVGCGETSVDCLHSSSTSSVPCCAGDGSDHSLKIAWRYKNLHLPVEFCLIIFTVMFHHHYVLRLMILGGFKL